MWLSLPDSMDGKTMPPKLEQGVRTERLQVLASATWIKRLDDWRRKQDGLPNRSEAIRILVEKALDEDR